jgi:hypothetical protein
MNAKRSMLTLAAVLAATVLTGGAAIAGLVHRSAPAPTPATVVQQAPTPPTQTWSEEGGD